MLPHRWLRYAMLAAASCGALPAQAGPDHIPGWGDSMEMPQGTPWTMPPGIVMAAEGLNPVDLEHCRNRGQKVRSNPIGTGGGVALCITFRNINPRGVGTQGPIKVTIRGGATFIPDNISTQNGIIIQKGTWEIRPGETLFLPIFLICMNPSRSSSVPYQTFRPGPVVQHPGVRRIIAMFEGKPLPQASFAAGALGSISTGRKIDRSLLDLIRGEWEALGVKDDPAKYLSPDMMKK
jgi:hypothetical protein